MTRALPCLLVAVVLAGCALPREPVRIGAKAFEEQAILAHTLAGLVRAQGLRASVVTCGDTFACHQALRQGDLDLMVEYTGTAISLAGLTGVPIPEARERLRALYAERGLRWLQPLGFTNTYAVVVPTARAAALGLETIADLERFEDGIRVAAPAVYARRPVDGLFPLLRRYGLRLADPPLLLEDPEDRYEALVSGRVDAAIAYSTDGALVGHRLRVLRDTLAFFPSYEAAVVARAALLRHLPVLESALARLYGQVDTATMQRLNARVQIEGLAPSLVAREFLHGRGLVAGRALEPERAELVVVHHALDLLDVQATRALRVVRAAFPDRAVRLAAAADPVDRLASAGARLALLGAERFFEPQVDGGFARDTRMDAVAVIGTRMVHVLRRREDARTLWAGRLGVPPAGSASARIVDTLLEHRPGAPVVRGSVRELVRAVAARALDAALVVAELQDPQLAELLASHPSLQLQPLPASTVERAGGVPFLRAARIPAQSYAGQPVPVETVGAQVVIAAPGSPLEGTTHMGGPGAALRTAGVPLTAQELDALVAATPSGEMPDPVLPSPWSLTRPGPAPRGITAASVDTLMNVFTWTYVAWLFWLLVRREGK